MKVTAFVTHSDCSLHDTGWGHPEHQGRLPAVARAVYRDMMTLFEPLLEVEAVPASAGDLLLAHTPAYIESVRAAVAASAHAGVPVDFTADTRVSAASWAAALAAVGSGITAGAAVMDGRVRNAFCAVRPPGHRVGRAWTRGHGLFNTAAIAALDLCERHGLGRVLIVDLGARAAAGTLDVIGDDARVALLSVHGSLDPAWREARSDRRSVALRPGATGAELLGALRGALAEIDGAGAPEAVILSLGCDALASDDLGDLALQPADYFAITRALVDAAERWCDGRLVSILEEGYDADGMGRAVVQHLRGLAGAPPAG